MTRASGRVGPRTCYFVHQAAGRSRVPEEAIWTCIRSCLSAWERLNVAASCLSTRVWWGCTRTPIPYTTARLVSSLKPSSKSLYDLAVSGMLITHSFELSLASTAPCVRKVYFCVTDTLFTWAVLLIQCLFDSRSAPLSKFILTCAVVAREWEFPGLLLQYVIYIERERLLPGKRQLQEYQI